MYSFFVQQQNNNLLIELSKVKNVRKYYYDLEQQFLATEQECKTLEKKLSANRIELDACYNVIKELLEKNEKMQKIVNNKLGIDIEKDKYKN